MPFRRHVLALLCAATITAMTAGKAAGGTSTCVGDCNGDGTVAISELILAVNIALGVGPLSGCRAIDADGNGQVEVSELIRAVNAALASCQKEDPVDLGLAEVAGGDLVAAESEFAAAVRSRPNDPRANLFLAITRLFNRTATKPAFLDLLGRTRVRIQGTPESVCEMRATAPDAIPDNAPRSQEIFDALRSEGVADIQEALDRLQKIPANAVIRMDLTTLPECVRPRQSIAVEIDHGDLLALRAALLAAQAIAQLLTAYDLDVRLSDAVELPPSQVFGLEDSLLTLRSADRLTAARAATRQSAEAFADAIDAVQAETDDQRDDILVILPEDDALAGRLKSGAILVRDSLTRAVTIPTDVGFAQPRQLDLSVLFSGRLHSLRQLVPPFDAQGNPDPARLRDPTFGGIFPDLSQADVDEIINRGRQCAPCGQTPDCVGLGLAHGLECVECFLDCDAGATGKRCAAPYSYTSCADGYYGGF